MANQPNSTKIKPKGGARPGAGRKPKSAKALEAQLVATALVGSVAEPLNRVEPASSAEYALSVIDRVMRDPQTEPDLRLRAASAMLDRVFGRPRQAVEAKHSGKMVIEVVYEDGPKNEC